MNYLANAYEDAGRQTEARKQRELAAGLRKKLTRPEPGNNGEELRAALAMGKLAVSYDEAGRHPQALHLREELWALWRQENGPDNPEILQALNALAWTLATSPAAEIRNGTNAVACAEQAVAWTHRRDPACLDTLAAAYAETQQFAKAVAVQQEAIGLIADQPAQTDYLSRLKLYQARQPCRE